MSSNVEIIINARDNASKNIRGVSDSLSTFQRGVGGLVRAIGPLTVAMGGMAIATKKGWDALKQGAELELTRERFDRLTESIGTTADAMLTKLQSATQGMVSDAELMASAGQIISLGLADTEDGVVRLANLISQLGWDMQQVILTFANNSKMRLDALGLSVEDVTKRAEALAETGMSMDQAFDMAVIEAGEEKLRLLGSAAETTAGQMQMLEADLQNVKNALLESLAGDFGFMLSVFSGSAAAGLQEQTSAMIEGAQGMEDLAAAAQVLLDKLQELKDNDVWDWSIPETQLRNATEAELRRIIEAMAQGTGSAEEFREALLQTFGPDAVVAIDNAGTEIINVAGGMGNLEDAWRSAQPTLAEFTNELERLAQVGREASEANDPLDRFARSIRELREASRGERGGMMGDLGMDTGQVREWVKGLESVEEQMDALKEAEEEAAAAAERLRDALAGIAQSTARENFTVLEDLAQARRDLAEASGVWVQAERDTSAEIAEINAQLANDLTDKEKKQWEERLDIIEEGSQEYINRARRLEEDLTESQRRELILRRAELQAQMGEPISLFTGDFAGMEEAQEKIAELEAALRENLVDAMIEAQIAAAGFGEGTIDLRLALGLIDEETANAEKAMLRVSQAVADLGAAVGEGKISEESANLMFAALLEAAGGTEEELKAIMDRIYAAINGETTATVNDPRLSGENLKNRMLAEVEGLGPEMETKGAEAGSALKEGMLPEIEVLEERVGGLPNIAAENPVEIYSNALDVAGQLDELSAKLQALGTITVTATVDFVGGGSGGGGGGTTGGTGGVYAASGFDFTVPPGFPNDSFHIPLNVSSNERVQVIPPGQSPGMGGAFINAPQVNILTSTTMNPRSLAHMVGSELSSFTAGTR